MSSKYYILKGLSLCLIINDLLLTSKTVSRAEGVAWNPSIRRVYEPNPNLYVEIGLGGAIQKTNTIKDNVAPAWDESLPL